MAGKRLLLLLMMVLSVSSQSLNATELHKFVDELPSMPVLHAFQTDELGNLKPGNLSIGMFRTKWKFHRDLPSSTVFAYGVSADKASVPGPTIEARNGVPAEILWYNFLPPIHILPLDPTISTARPKLGTGVPTVVHLHGGMNEPDSDGHSLAWFTAGFWERGPKWRRKTYYYHNAQGAGNLWYHDHAMGLTRINILAGLSGAYLIRDPQLEQQLNLPDGEFDRVLMITDRDFNRDGSIYMNPRGNNPKIHPEWQPEYFGSVLMVNGKAWPYLRVQQRKYRFRIINSSNARFYKLKLSAKSSSCLSFLQIGSDAFYLPRTVKARTITLAPSEIHDVVIDFSKARGDVVLKNSAAFPFPGGDPVDSNSRVVMKFVVETVNQTEPEKSLSDSSGIPSALVPIQKLVPEKAVVTRSINLYEFVSSDDEPTHLFINAVPFEAPATETPITGSTEIWNVTNLTEDNHPVHIHLAAFQVVSETKLKNVDKLRRCLLQNKNRITSACRLETFVDGKKSRPEKNEAGWKNVYKMKPSYLTSILVRFTAIDGTPYPFDATAEPGYSYHCHILDHEDNEMMRPLKLVK